MRIGLFERSAISISILIIFLFALAQFTFDAVAEGEVEGPMIGNAQNLRTAYDHWKVTNVKSLGDRSITLPLNWSKGRSNEYTEAHGEATFDLARGRVSVEVNGLPEREAFDVWLVEYRPDLAGNAIADDVTHEMYVGRLSRKGHTATLRMTCPQWLYQFL